MGCQRMRLEAITSRTATAAESRVTPRQTIRSAQSHDDHMSRLPFREPLPAADSFSYILAAGAMIPCPGGNDLGGRAESDALRFDTPQLARLVDAACANKYPIWQIHFTRRLRPAWPCACGWPSPGSKQ